MLYLTLMLQLGCITSEIDKSPGDFPDNLSDDYDNDGLSEFDGDCDDLNQNIQGPSLWYVDSDGDGFGNPLTEVEACQSDLLDLEEVYVSEGTDCDDENPEIHPDVEESCDGIDNNCSGEVDDYQGSNAPRWYYDDDNDGFGDAAVFTNACSAPAGHVADSTDCNDSDAETYPNAPEFCDGIDTNCNGIDDDNSAQDATLWYQDGDDDGHGSTVSQASCSQPSGYVVETGDCNDNNASVYPGADEYCNSVDDDCDGQTDELGAVDATTWYADLDSDGYGNAVLIEQACVASAGYVAEGTDCDDGDAAVYPNAAEYCNNGKDDDCDGQQDESDAVDPLAWYADTDGDGYGNPQQISYACVVPSGFVSDNTDCDDGNAVLNPADGDADGASTCGGDCDDGNALLNVQDGDGDGVTTCDSVPDCNDGDASVSPNASERCATAYDDDCDGAINESDAIDPNLWYADDDGDGYGDLQNQSAACDAPSGFVANSADCDDSDIDQYPGADEYCNTEDDDCDGTIDEVDAVDAVPFYPDNDGDGYGLNFVATYACTAQPGTVSDNTDCDDTTAQVRPGAAEFCNNRDDDCDGDLDEDAADATLFYVDNDGDGRGTTSATLLSCPDLSGVPTAPVGYSFFDDDCDDADATRAPNLPELCTATVDENCDGDTTIGATDVSMFLVDADGDTFGSGERDSNGDLAYTLNLCVQPYGYVPYTVNDPLDCNDGDFEVKPGAIEKCNGQRDDCPPDGDNSVPADEWDDDLDGFVECEIDSSFLYNSDGTVNLWNNNQVLFGGGDCEDSDVNAYPGAVEICNGVFDNCTHPYYNSYAAPVSETDDDGDNYVECIGFDSLTWEGSSSVMGGDDCNDGSALTFPGGAPLTDSTACLSDLDGDGYADRSWDLCSNEQVPQDARYTFIGEDNYDYSGNIISSAGDVDGDGLGDILIGAYEAYGDAQESGRVYLILGSSLSSSNIINLSSADYIFNGEHMDAGAGIAIAGGGDVDGDGLSDIFIGSPFNDELGTHSGKAYLILASSLSFNTEISLSDADYIFTSGISQDLVGRNLAFGDVNGDGLDDILFTSGGDVVVFHSSNLNEDQQISTDNYDKLLTGDFYSPHVVADGDVDGDGLEDVLIGDPYGGPSNEGKVYLLKGSTVSGSMSDTIDCELEADYSFLGENSSDNLSQVNSSPSPMQGHSSASMSFIDVNGDGLDEILLGSPDNDENQNLAGKGYLFYVSSLNISQEVNVVNADVEFFGDPTQQAGLTVSNIGDVDGDGLEDMLFGNRGKAFLLTSDNLSTITSWDVTGVPYKFDYNQTTYSTGFGQVFKSAGDIDGDGLDDILLSDWHKNTYQGETYLFSACEH